MFLRLPVITRFYDKVRFQKITTYHLNMRGNGKKIPAIEWAL